jgi:hypothetical protein
MHFPFDANAFANYNYDVQLQWILFKQKKRCENGNGDETFDNEKNEKSMK